MRAREFKFAHEMLNSCQMLNLCHANPCIIFLECVSFSAIHKSFPNVPNPDSTNLVLASFRFGSRLDVPINIPKFLERALLAYTVFNPCFRICLLLCTTDTIVNVKDESGGKTVVGRLTEDALNAQLEAKGLPKSKVSQNCVDVSGCPIP